MAERSDDDIVIEALRRIAQHGNLVLSVPTYVNGVRYDPATYVLTHVGVPMAHVTD